MSMPKSLLISLVIAKCAVITLDASQGYPPVRICPKAPQVRSLSCATAPMIAGFELSPRLDLPGLANPPKVYSQPGVSTSIESGKGSILGTAREINAAPPAPKLSVRTCTQVAYGSDKHLLPLIAKFGSRLKACDCHDAQESESPKATKFFHVLCDCCTDLAGNQVPSAFYRNNSTSCLERRNLYQSGKAAVKVASQESKS